MPTVKFDQATIIGAMQIDPQWDTVGSRVMPYSPFESSQMCRFQKFWTSAPGHRATGGVVGKYGDPKWACWSRRFACANSKVGASTSGTGGHSKKLWGPPASGLPKVHAVQGWTAQSL